MLTEIGVSNRWVERRPGIQRHRLASAGCASGSSAADPDLMSRRALWLAVSGAALVFAVSGILTQGLNLGVEFTGGRVLEYSTTTPLSADRAREVVADAGYPEATVQESDDDKITVRTGQISNDEAIAIETAIGAAGDGATKERDEQIGASLGNELRDKALIAFGIALLVQMIYLAFRFKWTFGAPRCPRCSTTSSS